MNERLRDGWIAAVFFLLSLSVYSVGLSVLGPEFRDDEVFYFKSTGEMLQDGNYLSPTYFGENRFQKPILYYWLILLSYKILGVHWFAARFVSVIFAGLSVACTWYLARALFSDRRLASVCALLLMTFPMFFRHAKNAVPDMPLNFFIVFALYQGVRFIQSPDKLRPKVLFFLACALGFMIKGFAAWIVPMGTLIAYAVYVRQPKLLLQIRPLTGFALMVAIIAPWFTYMAKFHGQEYVNYMVGEETASRLLGHEAQNFILIKAKEFFVHMGYYLQVILSYFAPWSLLLLCAFPWAIAKSRRESTGREALILLLIWCAVVYFFFSFMYFTIGHYMLVLSTPLAILLGYFLMSALDAPSVANRIMDAARRFLIPVFFTLYWIAYIFLMIYLVAIPAWWLIIFIAAYVLGLLLMRGEGHALRRPVVLGIAILFIQAHSFLLAEVGLTSHAKLQKFAERVHAEHKEKYRLAVGSHDIHEKEWQVYFGGQLIEKAADESFDLTRMRIYDFIRTSPHGGFILLTRQDYQKHLEGVYPGPMEVLRSDDIIRRRVEPDRELVKAIVAMDRATVKERLMEEVLLVRFERE